MHSQRRASKGWERMSLLLVYRKWPSRERKIEGMVEGDTLNICDREWIVE